MRKDVIKSLIAIKQNDIPFDVIERDVKLPTNRKKIITVPGVRRCGKSTMMEIAINELVRGGVAPQNILWLGFDDERLNSMTSEALDEVIVSYMEMFPDTPIKDVHMFFDEIHTSYCGCTSPIAKTFIYAEAMPPCSPRNSAPYYEVIRWNMKPTRSRFVNIAASKVSPPVDSWSRIKQG